MSTSRVEEFRSQFSSFFASLAAAFFIWLVGLVVFVPLSSTVSSPIPLSLLVSFAFLVAVVFFVSKSIRDGKGAIDRFEEIRGMTRTINGRIGFSRFRTYGYLSLILVVAILVVPLMWIISASLGGIMLVAVVFAAIVVAYPLIEAFIERTIVKNYGRS
jgi:hypothetical protein